MRIREVTYRHRNDFRFIAECDCGKTSQWSDGYADAFYQVEVFPNRMCPHCGENEFGETHEQQRARWAANEAAKSQVAS